MVIKVMLSAYFVQDVQDKKKHFFLVKDCQRYQLGTWTMNDS